MGDLALIPGLGRPPGEGNGYPLQYPGLENSMDCIGHGVAKSQIRQRLSFHFTNKLIYKIQTDLWISKTSLWLPLEKCWGRDTLGAWDKHTRLLCLTLRDSMDCSPPGPSIHGIFQVRILEWVVISCSRGSSWPRDPGTEPTSLVSPALAGDFLPLCHLESPHLQLIYIYNSNNPKAPTV